jgi:hypothetical protein
MDITEAQLTWLFGCSLILALVLGYPALTTAIALLRTQRALRKLFRHFVPALDLRRHR